MHLSVKQDPLGKAFLANKTLAAIPDPMYLTPESLLVYCQTRLRDLDRTIQERFSKENKTVDLQKKLGAIKLYIKDAAEDGVSDGEHADIVKMVDAAKALTTDSDLTAQLQALADSSTGADTKQSNTLGLQIDEINKNLGAGRDIAMVELQSIVSQRQTALQLTTNLLNAMNESTRNITGNIK